MECRPTAGTFPIQCYMVEFRHTSGGTQRKVQHVAGSRGQGSGCGDNPSTRVLRTDLEPGVRYQVLVQALSGDGHGDWSEMRTVRTKGKRTLKARFMSPPEQHDGSGQVKVRVAFSEAIKESPENVGKHGVQVEGGRLTSVRQVDNQPAGDSVGRSSGGQNDEPEDTEQVWEFELEPDSDDDLTLRIDAGRSCDKPGAICTADGRSLSEGIVRKVSRATGICDRTQEIQDAILAELADVDDCAAVTVANLASITSLGAFGLGTSNQGITSLQKGDFAGLTSLAILNLSRNTLTSLPEGIFAGLAELAELNLSEITLMSLPEGAFDGLVKLEDINLSTNSLTGIPEGAFSGLTALAVLYLSSNDLSSLPEDLFSGLTALEDLALIDNDLSSLPADVFSGLTALTTLSLKDNDLSLLPETVFSGLTALTKLELDENELSMLPETVFSDLTALTRIELHYNALSSLPAGLFSGLTALERIFLENNALNSLPAGLFSGLTSLTTLTLQNNALSSLPAGLFSGLTSLSTLDLGGNSTNPMELTVTVEKVGTNQVRAKVLAGAPFAVDIPVTPVNGTLAGSVTELGVAQGSVDGTAVTVTRTDGTTAAATVDVDLTTQPTLPTNNFGYIFKKATVNLPATILPAKPTPTHFYLWTSTMTVGAAGGGFGYSAGTIGSFSTGADFNYPPFSPPPKHNFGPDYQYTVKNLYTRDDNGGKTLVLDSPVLSSDYVGNATLWIRNTGFPLQLSASGSTGFSSRTGHDLDVPDLDWAEGDKVRVALTYERQLPSAPTNVRVTAPRGENGTLQVNWDEADAGTFPIEYYLVEFRNPNGETPRTVQSYVPSMETSVLRTDLERGVAYQVFVQALSGDGHGAESEKKTVCDHPRDTDQMRA